MNDRKHLPPLQELLNTLSNTATYIESIQLDSHAVSSSPLTQTPWSSFLSLFDTFLKNLSLILPTTSLSSGTTSSASTSIIAGVVAHHDLTPLLRIMLQTMKLPVINNSKVILDSYSKILSLALQSSPIPYEMMLELCNLCLRAFSKERDRFALTRAIAFELQQAMKFKSIIPDNTLMTVVQFMLQDCGGSLVPSVLTKHLKMNTCPDIECYSTGASESFKLYFNDCIDFIADIHALRRVKSNFLGTAVQLNEETIGGQLKAGISQWLSLEITKGYGRDHTAVTKFLPWLYSLPSVQQGPKEFLDCVSHVRILSWLLLGSLQHSALLHNTSQFSLCQPIPLEANVHLAEHIQAILAGFAEQSKASVIHMSALFYAFILGQLWTMYCENISSQNPPGGEPFIQCILVLSDFWSKITPGILQLVCHSKGLAEMVSLHFLSLMEALMDSNSYLLARMLPLWTPVFNCHEGQLSSALRVRLQTCISWQPPPQLKEPSICPGTNDSTPMLRWLQKIQFKMTQVELQSSEATQFYTI